MKILLPFFCLLLSYCAFSQSFTAGNLVVYRIGTGTGSLVNTGNPVFLDEYTTAGTLVQSVSLPTIATGTNKPLIASGTATSEGLLTLSANNQYLVLTGYGTTVGGTASLSGTPGATVPRIVGLVKYDGTINTTTALSDYADGNNPRGATSTNGTDIWADGGAGGIRYATAGSNTSTQISTTYTNLRNIAVFNGQLYVSSGSSTLRLGTVGTGTPTTSGQTITNLPGLPSSGTSSFYQFLFADLNAAIAGPDVLYVSDDATGILKYSLVAGSWVANGTVGAAADAYRGLTGVVSGGNVTLYATRKGGSGATGGGELVQLTDNSGYNATITGTPLLLATASSNTAFRGVAPAPTGGTVPLHLLSFTAGISDRTTDLRWTATDEINFCCFTVERSADGVHFAAIRKINADNTVNPQAYIFNDAVPLPTSYYRLKMEDRDGAYTYSNTILVKQSSNSNVSVFPNPAIEVLSLTLTGSLADEAIAVSIYSIQGQLLIEQKIPAGTAATSINISKLTPGIYLLTTTVNGKKEVVKFTRE